MVAGCFNPGIQPRSGEILKAGEVGADGVLHVATYAPGTVKLSNGDQVNGNTGPTRYCLCNIDHELRYGQHGRRHACGLRGTSRAGSVCRPPADRGQSAHRLDERRERFFFDGTDPWFGLAPAG